MEGMAGQPAQATKHQDNFLSISAGASILTFCNIMNHILALLIAPTVTTAFVSITYGVMSASPLGAVGVAMIFGIYCFTFTILIGVPGLVLFHLLKIKSALAYAFFGFLSGVGIVQYLAGDALTGRFITSAILMGIIGMLNSIVFVIALRFLSAEQAADGKTPEAHQSPH
jgi:hypothetical protein